MPYKYNYKGHVMFFDDLFKIEDVSVGDCYSLKIDDDVKIYAYRNGAFHDITKEIEQNELLFHIDNVIEI
jgi:hypothetical protein